MDTLHIAVIMDTFPLTSYSDTLHIILFGEKV